MNFSTLINSSAKIQLLYVEDDRIDRLAFTCYMKQMDLPYEYTLASSLSEALEILCDRVFHIAILDYNLGDGHSSELFPILTERNCPFVISTGSGDEETAARLMSQGAVDYLIKDPERNYLKVLPVMIDKILSRYQAQGQLQLLSHAMQSIEDSIYIVDDAGRLQYINNTLADFSNISPEEAIGQPLQILNQPYLEEWLGDNRSCSNESYSVEAEILMRRGDGTTFLALVSESCIIENKQVSRIGVIRNITSLKKIERELRNYQEGLEIIVKERTRQLLQVIADLQQENQERLKTEASLRASHDRLQKQQEFFRAVIDSDPNLIFVKDWDGRYLLANQEMARFYNTTVENLLGKTDTDFHRNRAEVDRFVRENRQIIETKQEMFLPEERITYADLGYQWLQWQKRPIKLLTDNVEDNIDGVLGVGVNITARKLTEISLSESQQLFASLAKVAPVGIFRTDARGNCIYVNDRWCQIAGLTHDEALGIGWHRGLHPEDCEAIFAEWSQSVEANRPFQLEYRFQRTDGVITWVYGQSLAEYDADGQLLGYVGTITDITDRKRAEIVLQKLVTGTAAVTGTDFFLELVRHIAEALDVTYALVTEFVDGRLITLAFWAHGRLQPSISYFPANTPCEITLQAGEYHCGQFVQEIFSEDFDLVTMEAESYLGIALKDDRGEAIGNLCILDTKPITQIKQAEAIAILQVFAARASVELQRKNVNKELNQLNQELEVRVQQRTQELQEREAQLRDLFDNATDLIQSVSPEGKFLFVNRAWRETFGYSKAELEHLSIFEVIHPEDITHCQIERERLFTDEQEQSIRIETRFLTKDGRTIVLEGNVSFHVKDGTLVSTRGIFRDITERKQAQKALEESQRLLQTVLDCLPSAVFWKDRQSVMLGCNQVFAIAAGVASPTEAIGKSNFDFSYSEEEKLKYTLDDREVMESGIAKIGFQETISSPNGDMKWVETNKIPLRNSLGEVVGVVCTFQDISDRKQAEQELQKTTDRLALALKSGAVGCWEWDIKQNILVWDDRMYELYGSAEEAYSLLPYEAWANAVHPDDREEAETLLEQSILGQTDYDFEFRVIHPDRSVHFIKAYGKVTQDTQGDAARMIGINFDISDRKQAEAQLKQINEELLRATKLKDEFLANMSHELRTPLNSILGMNEVLQEQIFGSINERQLNALQIIESSSRHLLSLINDILDVAKIESGQVTLDLATTDIESLCTSSLLFISQQVLTKQIQLIPRIPKHLPEIVIDGRRIRQVLINLLNNAVKFTPEGGTVTLEVSQFHLDKSTTNQTTLNYLRIAVIDTGIGIAAENLQKLFQPFIQIDSSLNRQYNGTGLGLTLVKKLVELHGGNVELTSELGVGSCFAINLPFSAGSPAREEQTQEQPEDDLSGQSPILPSQTEEITSPVILLAEDNEANTSTFLSYLEAKGYHILLAIDGQQAIDFAKAHHPNLILMDIQMPVIDGIEAIKQIRLNPDLVNTPIIALTSLAMAGDRERCLGAGASDYLSKPVKLKALDTMIKAWLRNHL